MVSKIQSNVNKYALEILFSVSLAATLASLVLSNVLGYPPCDLCWYQRIFMFPLPLIFGTGLVLKDRKSLLYAAPVIAAGLAVAVYHNLLQWGIVSENLLECSYTAVSCADPIINWFGFMTIPLGSLVMFSVVGLISWVTLKSQPLKVKTDSDGANRLLVIAGIMLVMTAIAAFILGK